MLHLGKQTIEIASLPSKKQGRPPLLGYKLDQLLQEQIVSMRKRGTPISSHMVIGVARGLLLKHNRSFLNDFGGPITLTKDWAICVMRGMGYTKRRANSQSQRYYHRILRISKNNICSMLNPLF